MRWLRIWVSRPCGSCRVNAFRGALFPSKSGLMNKHIVKQTYRSEHPLSRSIRSKNRNIQNYKRRYFRQPLGNGRKGGTKTRTRASRVKTLLVGDWLVIAILIGWLVSWLVGELVGCLDNRSGYVVGSAPRSCGAVQDSSSVVK